MGSTSQNPVAISPETIQSARPTLLTAAHYASDYRNMNHSLIPPQACFYSQCKIHYLEKTTTGRFPQHQEWIGSKCDGPWFQCFTDTCEAHLWDKRAKRYFPGRDDPAEQLRMRAVLKGECEQVRWETCLQDHCSEHYRDKQLHGFLETR